MSYTLLVEVEGCDNYLENYLAVYTKVIFLYRS